MRVGDTLRSSGRTRGEQHLRHRVRSDCGERLVDGGARFGQPERVEAGPAGLPTVRDDDLRPVQVGRRQDPVEGVTVLGENQTGAHDVEDFCTFPGSVQTRL